MLKLQPKLKVKETQRIVVSKTNYSKEEIKLIKGGGYQLKFKFLELLSDAFAKNG